MKLQINPLIDAHLCDSVEIARARAERQAIERMEARFCSSIAPVGGTVFRASAN
jgi:hypothetical protein